MTQKSSDFPVGYIYMHWIFVLHIFLCKGEQRGALPYETNVHTPPLLSLNNELGICRSRHERVD